MSLGGLMAHDSFQKLNMISEEPDSASQNGRGDMVLKIRPIKTEGLIKDFAGLRPDKSVEIQQVQTALPIFGKPKILSNINHTR